LKTLLSGRLHWGFAELNEFGHIGAALDESESALLYFVVRLHSARRAEASDARDNTGALDFAAKTADYAHGVFTSISGYFNIYHRFLIIAGNPGCCKYLRSYIPVSNL
jgi:hypothetical protein